MCSPVDRAGVCSFTSTGGVTTGPTWGSMLTGGSTRGGGAFPGRGGRGRGQMTTHGLGFASNRREDAMTSLHSSTGWTDSHTKVSAGGFVSASKPAGMAGFAPAAGSGGVSAAQDAIQRAAQLAAAATAAKPSPVVTTPAAVADGDGKKRRSRWEEPVPAPGPAVPLTKAQMLQEVHSAAAAIAATYGTTLSAHSGSQHSTGGTFNPAALKRVRY